MTIVIPADYRASEYRIGAKLKLFVEKNFDIRASFVSADFVELSAETSVRLYVGFYNMVKKAVIENFASIEQYGYCVLIENGCVCIYADSIEGYEGAYSHICEKLVGNTVDLPPEYFFYGVYCGETQPEKLEKPDIRMLFSNVLGWCDKLPFYYNSRRVRMLAELYHSYSPDIIGLQECWDKPTRDPNCSIVDLLARFGYYEVPVRSDNEKKTNFTPLFIKKDRFKLLDCGYFLYTGDLNDVGSKSVTWAVLEVIESGKRFIAADTHLFWQHGEAGDIGRVENVKQLTLEAKALCEKYNAPFVIGGDFNARLSSTALTLLQNSGFENIHDISLLSDNINTCHSYPKFSEELGTYISTVESFGDYRERAIDHAFVYNRSDSMEFNRFKIVSEEFALAASDHCPIMIDFKL